MRERYKALPLNYVGHSFGGLALGLLSNNTEVSRALFIAAQARLLEADGLAGTLSRLRHADYVGLPLTKLLGYARAGAASAKTCRGACSSNGSAGS